MGSVLSVQPSLEQVNVLVEIKEPTTVIPRNSHIEANQSGLIAESLIDITPQLPIPDYKVSLWQPSSPPMPALFHLDSFVCLGHCSIKSSQGMPSRSIILVHVDLFLQMLFL